MTRWRTNLTGQASNSAVRSANVFFPRFERVVVSHFPELGFSACLNLVDSFYPWKFEDSSILHQRRFLATCVSGLYLLFKFRLDITSIFITIEKERRFVISDNSIIRRSTINFRHCDSTFPPVNINFRRDSIIYF